ncbi:MAG: DUF433 domain-containing protein [Deltaproteobacteria bacterium]|nr:DUF433 domain-containing protein [Deltaproteobacteria bacterium]
MRKYSRIVINPKIMGGKPVIRGTRVPVQVVVGALAGGMTTEEVCKEYHVTNADVFAALAYAAETLAEEKVYAVPRR